MPASRRKVRGTTAELQETARVMRADMTPAEGTLWAALRRKQLGGLRFRSQHPVGPYVLDFCCPEHKLVVEVDGGVHDGRTERDADRTAHLESYGYRVIRFRNDEVMEDLPSVLQRILGAALAPPTAQYWGTERVASAKHSSAEDHRFTSGPPVLGGRGEFG